MARPRGKQMFCTCRVCGRTKELPPSKAATHRYCSRRCRDDGLHLEAAWRSLIESLLVRDVYFWPHLPAGPDPLDRGRREGSSVFVRERGGWLCLQLSTNSMCIRVEERQYVSEAEVPRRQYTMSAA